MKKVILKCKLTSRDKFEEKLSDIDLDFSSIYWQHDRVYVPRGYKRGMNLPRLVMRTEMKAVDKPPKYSLILRRQELKMGEGTYIYLDKIDGKNGYYAKIESNLAANDSVAAAKSDLQKTFETLGENNFIDSTYFEIER